MDINDKLNQSRSMMAEARGKAPVVEGVSAKNRVRAIAEQAKWIAGDLKKIEALAKKSSGLSGPAADEALGLAYAGMGSVRSLLDLVSGVLAQADNDGVSTQQNRIHLRSTIKKAGMGAHLRSVD